MSERRRFWQINFTIKFLNFALIGVTLFFLAIFYALWKVIALLEYSTMWQIYLVVLQLSLTGFILTLIIVMFLILNRILGPVSRMEKVLEKIVNGDYSLRISIRERDILFPFVTKVNKIIELLQEKTKV